MPPRCLSTAKWKRLARTTCTLITITFFWDIHAIVWTHVTHTHTCPCTQHLCHVSDKPCNGQQELPISHLHKPTRFIGTNWDGTAKVDTEKSKTEIRISDVYRRTPFPLVIQQAWVLHNRVILQFYSIKIRSWPRPGPRLGPRLGTHKTVASSTFHIVEALNKNNCVAVWRKRKYCAGSESHSPQ